ncbi:MAG TPA: hypothetical protein VE843_17765, partial [Ktedonobacteraceae bacterium]|nr:hypothetical protein [Ktedonobacteraceae bacterium]
MSPQSKSKKIVAVFACYMVLTLNFNQLYASGPDSGGVQASGTSGTTGGTGTTGTGGTGARNLASLKTVAIPGPTAAELSG